MTDDLVISPEQVRAARALLNLSQGELARRAGVATSTIADFEKGQRTPIANNLNAIRTALEAAGVDLSAEDGLLAERQFSLFFVSQGNAAELRIRFNVGAEQAVGEVLAVFGNQGSGEATIEVVQTATPALKHALQELVAKHQSSVPQLHQVNKFVAALRNDEYFLLFPERAASTAERLERERLVHRLNSPGEPDNRASMDMLFGPLIERYDISLPRTDKHTVIGKANRVHLRCRFCGRTAEEGATFKSAAHAIPTALGNDFLKVADECDDCNNYFGRNTEPSLIAMLDIQRAFLGIQGRGKNDGRPVLEYSEGKISHDGQSFAITSSEISKDDGSQTISVHLGSRIGAGVVPVAAYKALVKIALSVIDRGELSRLKKTVEWLRCDMHKDTHLPSVSAAVINLPPNPSAQIVVYRRKDDRSRLPHLVGEFRLGCFLYVFAVPLSDRDSWDLVGFFQEAEFRDTFKHYASHVGWSQHDLNGRNRVFLSPQIKFVPKS